MRKEQEIVFQNENREQLLEGKIDRREFMSKTLTAGLGLAVLGLLLILAAIQLRLVVMEGH